MIWTPILSIEPDGEEECACISVSHPSSLYVTDGGIITHNTTVNGGPPSPPSATGALPSGGGGRRGLSTVYRSIADTVKDLKDGMRLARSTRERRTVEGTQVPDTAYDVRTDIAMRQASMEVIDSLVSDGIRGPELLESLRNRQLQGSSLDMDERQILLRHMLQTGRFIEVGLSRREIMAMMQEGAGAAAMTMREMGEILDPIERLRQEAEERTGESFTRLVGQGVGETFDGMMGQVASAQDQAVIAELNRLRAESQDLREALNRHREDMENSRQEAARERLAREEELRRLQGLLATAEASIAELQAKPSDSAEANQRLADALIEARERASELQREIRDLQEYLAEETDRANQEREIGIAIGREEGIAEAEAAIQTPEAQLDRFEAWLMGERFAPGLEGLPSVETFARRFIQSTRFDAEGFASAIMQLFPAVDQHIVEDAMDRVATSLANAAEAARHRQIESFVDGLAGRLKKTEDQERLGRFLGSLQRASAFGILDQDQFTNAFAHAFNLNGLTPAIAQRLLAMWHNINAVVQPPLANAGQRVHFGMVRETLERQFLEAVDAVAPGARWDNFIFSQFQSAVLSSVSSGLNQFSGIFRVLAGVDATARLAAQGNYNPVDVMAEWWRNASSLFGNLPFIMTGIRGESLGHLPPVLGPGFTPREQTLQAARNQPMRIRLPDGRSITMPMGLTRLLRAKEMWSWSIIRGAEGVSGITDAQARFIDVLSASYQRQGMGAGDARRRAVTDITASPAVRQAAEVMARQEQASGTIGRGEAVIRRRIQEIVNDDINARMNDELVARTEHLAAAAQFKTMPVGPIGYAISHTFRAMTGPEGAGRLARFFFLFGRFMGHTVDTTLGYIPGAHLLTMGRTRGTTQRHEIMREVYGSIENYNAQQHGKAVAGGAFLLATGALQLLAMSLAGDDDEPWFAVTGFAPGVDRDTKERLKATTRWDEGQIRIAGRPVLNYSQVPELVPLFTMLGNASDYLRFGSGMFRAPAAEGQSGAQPMSAQDIAMGSAVDVLMAPIKRSTYKQWLTAADQAMKGRGGDAFANIITSPIGGALRLPLLVDADKAVRKEAGAVDAKGLYENTLRRIPFVVVGEKMINPYGEQLPGFDVIGMFPGNAEVSPEIQRVALLNLETGTTRGTPQLSLTYADGTVREPTQAESEQFMTVSGRHFVESALKNEAAIRKAFATGGTGAAQKIISNITRAANARAKEEIAGK